MPESPESRCLYRILDNGVHEFVMLEFSRAGVDAFVDAVAAMSAGMSPDKPVPLLIDSSRGTQPVNYLFNRLRELNRTSPKPAERGRVAFIHQPGIIATMVDSMMRIFPAVRVRLFTPDERDKAMGWLTEKA